MKLKCDKHQRRVLTTSRGFAHRTGDMSLCDSTSASMTNSKAVFPQAKTRTYEIDNEGHMHLAWVDGQPAIDLSRR